MKKDNYIYEPLNLAQIVFLIIGSMIFLSGFIVAIIGLTYSATSKVVGTIEVDCFDEFENKIDGLVCQEEVKCSNVLKWFNDDECDNFKGWER